MSFCWVQRAFPAPLETSEQNYWLGYLMGDGCLANRKKEGHDSFALCLGSKDKTQVEKFRSFIFFYRGRMSKVCTASARKNTVEGRVIFTKKIYSISIYCTQEVDNLRQHGLVERKSGKEIFPETITNIPAFILGYFDADGCVYVNERSNSLSFIVTSLSEKLISRMNWEIFRILHCEGYCSFRGAHDIRWHIGKDLAKSLYQFLYASVPSFLPLDRKRERFEKYIKT